MFLDGAYRDKGRARLPCRWAPVDTRYGGGTGAHDRMVTWLRRRSLLLEDGDSEDEGDGLAVLETAEQRQRIHVRGHRAVRERLLECDPYESVRPSRHPTRFVIPEGGFLRDRGTQYLLQQHLPAHLVVPAGSRRGVKGDALRDPRRGEAIERDPQRAAPCACADRSRPEEARRQSRR
jgi:hypothetical protein